MLEMSSLDLFLLEQMEGRVLKKAQTNRRPRKSVEVGCPDCDKIKDKLSHHGKVIGQKLHPVGNMHGGGAAFDENSPLNGPVPFPMAWFCYKINEAFAVKDTHFVAWYIHVPCGAAYGLNLNVAQLIELQLTNRGRFIEYMNQKHPNSRLEVVPYVHIDYDGVRGSKVRETREVDLSAWLEYRHDVMNHLQTLPYRLPIVTAL